MRLSFATAAEEARLQGQGQQGDQEGTRKLGPHLVAEGCLLTDVCRLQFVINASQPASDKIFDVSAFEKFLNEKIKVEGRVGNLGDTINISQTSDGKIEIVAHNELSGRYLKYLYAIHPLLLDGGAAV